MHTGDVKNKHQKSYQQNVIRATSTSHVGINNTERLNKAYGSLANRIEIINKIQKHSLFTRCWFSIFYILGIICLCLDFSGAIFNVLDLFIVMIAAYLIARNKVIGMYTAIIECLLYAFICYNSQLFGEVVKVLCISIPLYIYSIIMWKKANFKLKNSSKNNQDVVIKKLTLFQKILCIICLIALAIVCFFFLKFILGQEKALILSSFSLAILIIGRVLTANHFMENYIVFILGGFIGLGIWIETMIVSGFTVAALSMVIYRCSMILNDSHSYGLWKAMHRRIVINNRGSLFARRKIKINKIIKLRRRYRNLHWDKEIDTSKNS